MAYESEQEEEQGAPAQPASAAKNVFHLTSDMFPEGMAKTLKAGEVIEFRVVSPVDSDGDVAMEYNTGTEGTPPAEEGGEQTQMRMDQNETEGSGNWDNEARKALSPQKDESEAY